MAHKSGNEKALGDLAARISDCHRCPRLVAWREAVAADPPKRYQGQTYWARPLPGFGDPAARVVVVGLAPAAHGGNRTGRVFTGDRSADWLFAAMHRAGYANQAESVAVDDGLRLTDAWVNAIVRCAPPENKPTPIERDTCLPWLDEELRLLPNARVFVALGAFAWDGLLRALRTLGYATPKPKPKFAHGAEAEVGPFALLGSYHVSQQNTFTGKLTEDMLDAIFTRARELSDG
jgi:uracil-DNA glycosylase family 4